MSVYKHKSLLMTKEKYKFDLNYHRLSTEQHAGSLHGGTLSRGSFTVVHLFKFQFEDQMNSLVKPFNISDIYTVFLFFKVQFSEMLLSECFLDV
jgi:hypothetical protein